MDPNEPQLEVDYDAGWPIVECLFTRTSDSATMSLSVRTSNNSWLSLQNPCPALAALIQQGLSDPNTEVKAYLVNGEANVGVIVRSRRCR